VFDVLTIAAVADELTDVLIDGRFQRLGLIDSRSLAAEVYAGGRRHHLVASADDAQPRLLLTSAMPSIDSELVTPFGLLLRKYVRGGILVGIEQPPLERMVRLSIAKRISPHNRRDAGSGDDAVLDDELAEETLAVDLTYVHLAVEIMGRHSNLILIDDNGRIMECAKRVTARMSRVRQVLPGLPYQPPPPLDRPDPRRLTSPDATALLNSEPPTADLAKMLVRRLRGLSPQIAREIAFRVAETTTVAVGQLSPDAAAALARETRGLVEPILTAAWRPTIYRDTSNQTEASEGEAGPVVAFAAVPMAHLAATYAATPMPSISHAAEVAMQTDAEPSSPRRHEQRRERLLASLGAARTRLERRREAIRQQQRNAERAEQLRQSGDFIYAYLWQITPGQSALDVDGQVIPLDPTLSAKENAQDYFERYRKARDAGDQLPALMQQVETEIAYLDQLITLASQAERFADLEAVSAEWTSQDTANQPDAKRQRRGTADRRPQPLRDRHGNSVLIGRSGTQNEMVTFDIAGPNDSWLHARGVPGSHVIVRWQQTGAADDQETLQAAAALAAYYSAARGSATVEVDITPRRYVRKIKGSGPGMVTYRNERTVAVQPAVESDLTAVLRSAERT